MSAAEKEVDTGDVPRSMMHAGWLRNEGGPGSLGRQTIDVPMTTMHRPCKALQGLRATLIKSIEREHRAYIQLVCEPTFLRGSVLFKNAQMQDSRSTLLTSSNFLPSFVLT